MSKILCFIDNLGSGGAQRQLVTIAKIFKSKNHDVSFLIYGSSYFFLEELKFNQIYVHECKTKNYISRIFKIRNHIRKNNYDVVISFLETPSFLNNFSAIGGKGWKVITSERSSKTHKFVTVKGKIYGFFQRYADFIVCNSNNARQLWINYYPKYEKKVTTIYNAVQLPEISSVYIPKKDKKIHLVVAASYQYLKNPLGLVKALSLLDSTEREKFLIEWYGQIEIVKIGTKPYDETKKFIKDFNLENVVNLYGPTKSIANIMNKADFVALFSKVEGLPNVICEAMMIGKPIIMTRVSDYERLVDDSNGFLCDSEDPESIKNTLIKANKLTDNEIIRMGNNSKRKAEKLFEENIIYDSWKAII